MGRELTYKTSLAWTEKKKAKVAFEDMAKEEIEIAVAPEFLGHPGIVTPEDLFVSSINSCLMSYFLNVAEKMRVRFSSYESSAVGTLSEVGMDFIFSKIEITVRIVASDEKSSERAARAMEMAKKGCFVSNSVKSEVVVNYDVTIG
ncbi:MAG: OsmC family protein [Candidatus Methanofastidiosa archaeon]|nr:OsmC family protein [Candidatus Methanofastidiosa archaeon]